VIASGPRTPTCVTRYYISSRAPSIDPLTSLRFFCGRRDSVSSHARQVWAPRRGGQLWHGRSHSFSSSRASSSLTFIRHRRRRQIAPLLPGSLRPYLAAHAATLLFAALVLAPAYTDRGVGSFIANALPSSILVAEPGILLLVQLALVEHFQRSVFLSPLSTRNALASAVRRNLLRYGCFLLVAFLVGGNLEPTRPLPTATNVVSWYVFVQMGPAVRFFEFLFGMGLGFLYSASTRTSDCRHGRGRCSRFSPSRRSSSMP